MATARIEKIRRPTALPVHGTPEAIVRPFSGTMEDEDDERGSRRVEGVRRIGEEGVKCDDLNWFDFEQVKEFIVPSNPKM